MLTRFSALKCQTKWARSFPLYTSCSPLSLKLAPTMDDSYHHRHHSRRQHHRPGPSSHPASAPAHLQYGGGRQQQTFLPPRTQDSYFRPPGPPGPGGGPMGYHGPQPDFAPKSRPLSVGPHPPPSPFGNWGNSSFNGPPPPPGFSSGPPPPNFPLPPDERWNMRAPFVGPGSGGQIRGDPHTMNFPTPHGMPMDFNLPMNSSNHNGGKFGSGNFHSEPHANNHRHRLGSADGSFHPHDKPSKGEWHMGGARQLRSGENFPLQNGIDGYHSQFHFEGGGELSSHRVKRIKTGSQSVPKRRTPKRPLVDINKELKMKHSTQLSVVSYNLLAQDLIEKNMHLYMHCSEGDLSWEYRRNNLLSDLTQSSADILCLQEVQGEHYHRWYQPQLSKQGYTGLYKRRTGSYSDGCAVFYKEARLKLLEWKGLEYQRKVNVLNRDNVAVLAKFSLIENSVDREDAVFCIANTHLLYNPKAGEVKLAQVSYLLAELHKMAVTGTGELLPVLVCGDFNSTPNSPLLNFLTTSHLNYAHLSALVIAGYYEGGARSRAIPVPLLPPEMNIGHDCTYKQHKGGSEVAAVTAEGKTSQIAGPTGRKGYGDGMGEDDVSEAKCTRPVAHSEFTSSDMDVDSVSDNNCSVRTTRSVRGAKLKGHTSTRTGSESRSLLGSSSTTKRGRGGHSLDTLGVDDLNLPKSSPSGGGSSVEDNLDGEGGKSYSSQGYQSRASGTEDSAMGSLESSINSVTKQSAANSSKMDINHKNDSKNCVTKGTGLLGHPFKLLPAYPISKSPSTITTYHQCAFETVDYIFFSPIACRASGEGRKQLSGFNLLKRRVLPSTHTLLDLGPQPHQFLSSDHLLLQATFQLAW